MSTTAPGPRPADPPVADAAVADGAEGAPSWRHDVVVAAVVVVACELAALPIGLLWGHFADHPVYQVGGGQLGLVAANATKLVRTDALFLIITGVAGIVAAVLAFWRCQRGKVGATIGLALGGFAGSWLAWRVGHGWTGGIDQLTLLLRGNGSKAALAPDLGARAVLVSWPVAALVLNAVLYAVTWPAGHKAGDAAPGDPATAQGEAEPQQSGRWARPSNSQVAEG